MRFFPWHFSLVVITSKIHLSEVVKSCLRNHKTDWIDISWHTMIEQYAKYNGLLVIPCEMLTMYFFPFFSSKKWSEKNWFLYSLLGLNVLRVQIERIYLFLYQKGEYHYWKHNVRDTQNVSCWQFFSFQLLEKISEQLKNLEQIPNSTINSDVRRRAPRNLRYQRTERCADWADNVLEKIQK